MKVEDLRQGQVLICTTRLGFPLRISRDARGRVSRSQPTRRGSTRFDDLATFFAWFVRYENGFLHLEVQPYRQGLSTIAPYGSSCPAVVHVTGLKRVRLLSSESIESTKTFPVGRSTPLGGGFQNYRVIEEVRLR